MGRDLLGCAYCLSRERCREGCGWLRLIRHGFTFANRRDDQPHYQADICPDEKPCEPQVHEQDRDTRARYRWQLTCLPDGRNRNGDGYAENPFAARWAGVQDGVTSLQNAILKGKRSVEDFGLEIRLPGIGGKGQQLIRTAPRELQQSLQRFANVHIVTLEGATAR